MTHQVTGMPDSSLSLLGTGDAAKALIESLIVDLTSTTSEPDAGTPRRPCSASESLQVGIAALDAFLQANVTGPVLHTGLLSAVQSHFIDAWRRNSDEESTSSADVLDQLRKACLKTLEVDGVSPYAYIPNLELFSLAKHITTKCLDGEPPSAIIELPSYLADKSTTRHSIAWTRLRIDAWHYKLLTQPSLGPGSNFTKSSQWSDVPTLAGQIAEGVEAVRNLIIGDEVWAENDSAWQNNDKVVFLLEAANNYILLGRSDLAKQAVRDAAQLSGLKYALSGALGKRTKFQENSTSQLVVLAKSSDKMGTTRTPAGGDDEEEAKPDAVQLNDDTLYEDIQFTKDERTSEAAISKTENLPATLADLNPSDQPQLSALDQIVLLTEATIKDAFSPVDTLTSEEILPYAVRVLADKSTNWQIYTQALLVRSRIELHRSRTLERGVLQLQAVADQVLTDTTAAVTEEPSTTSEDTPDLPAIQVTTTEDKSIPVVDKPTTFFPAPKASESAPAHVRLQYVHALSAPPRWHLESELAYSWAGVGSLISALEIFKRLRLWAEVALCLASTAATEDEDGRGSGGEEKAKGIIRWRLFQKTGSSPVSPSDADEESVGDVTQLKAADFSGPERSPPPPNAARLWCILGDLESDPSHYERAWNISKNRYARAQKSLGEHYLSIKEWEKARDAYRKATSVNRMSSDMWSRLGDIALRLGHFEEASEAYNRSIASATDTGGGEGARTWSNLGSALWSLYLETVSQDKPKNGQVKPAPSKLDDEEEDEVAVDAASDAHDPSKLITQSLAAYKKGASITHDNWRIWDNVLTLASRIRPPPIADMVLALRHIIRIRKSEDAIDADVLAALLQDAVLSKDKGPVDADGVYEPPRGSPERLVARFLEEEVVPLITHRSELWTIISRLRTWRGDYAGVIDAAERAWRAATGGGTGAALLSGTTTTAANAGPSSDWTTDEAAWEVVVARTDELASALENWGPGVETVGPKWKGRVRSAVRTVMGRGRERWEGSEGWKTLEGIMEGLKR